MNKSIIWITGLSGAGKTTLANELVALLRADGKAVVFLDGDDLREVFSAVESKAENHDLDRRLTLAMQYAKLCRVIASQGFVVVIATISLFREVHTWNRSNQPFYFEVYLKVPIAELRRRDPKGIYRRFDAGELTHVAGMDLHIDEPEAADWIVDFKDRRSSVDMARDLYQILLEKAIVK